MKQVVFLLLAILCLGVRAEFPVASPYEAISYKCIVTENPRREIHIAIVDLTSKEITLRVAPGGEDPDGAGPCSTTLMKPSAIANREDFDLAVNGDFFGAAKVQDANGKPRGYATGVGAWPIGPAVTGGVVWAKPEKARAMLVITDKNRAYLARGTQPPADAREVVAGQPIILEDGKIVVENNTAFQKTPHPRTAVGISEDGRKLILVVVDGRRKDATGMPLVDLAQFLKAQGAHNALNLDGGGSSEMVLRNPETGNLHVVNQPSDARERSVANVLGVKVKGSKQTEEVVLDRLPPATQKSE